MRWTEEELAKHQAKKKPQTVKQIAAKLDEAMERQLVINTAPYMYLQLKAEIEEKASIYVRNIPLCPSTNGLFIQRGRIRVLSPKYREWREIAGPLLDAQKPGEIRGPIKIDVTLGKADNRRRDADNYLKANLDLLTQHGIIGDDSDIWEITVRWSPGPALTTMRISPFDPPAMPAKKKSTKRKKKS